MQKRPITKPDTLTRVSQHVGKRHGLEELNLQPDNIQTIRPGEARVPGVEYSATGILGFMAETVLREEVGLGDAEIRHLHAIAAPQEVLLHAA